MVSPQMLFVANLKPVLSLDKSIFPSGFTEKSIAQPNNEHSTAMSSAMITYIITVDFVKRGFGRGVDIYYRPPRDATSSTLSVISFILSATLSAAADTLFACSERIFPSG